MASSVSSSSSAAGRGGGGRPTGGGGPTTLPLRTLLHNAVAVTRQSLFALTAGLPEVVHDADKKRRIRDVCQAARQRLIRLRALCAYMAKADRGARLKNAVDAVADGAQRASYVLNAHVRLAREHEAEAFKLVPAFDVRAAIDVLSTGTYPHLPAHPLCQQPTLRPLVEQWAVPSARDVLRRMDRELAFLVLNSDAKRVFTSATVRGGRIELVQRGEFRLEVTRGREDQRWHLLRADLLFGQARGPGSLHARPDMAALSEAVQRMPLNSNTRTMERPKVMVAKLRERYPTWHIDLALVLEVYGRLKLRFILEKMIRIANEVIAARNSAARDPGGAGADTATTTAAASATSAAAPGEDDVLYQMFVAAHTCCCGLMMNALRSQALTLKRPQACAVLGTHGRAYQTLCFRFFQDSGFPADIRITDFSTATDRPLAKRHLSVRVFPAVQPEEEGEGLDGGKILAFDTVSLDCLAMVCQAKRVVAGHRLTLAYAALFDVLPWFMAPGDVHLLKADGGPAATAVVVRLNGVVRVAVQVDVTTGRFHCSAAAAPGDDVSFSEDARAPLADSVAACRRVLERAHYNLSRLHKSGSVLATMLSHMQAAIVTVELEHAAGAAGLDLIDPALARISSAAAATISSAAAGSSRLGSTARVWRPESTTVVALKTHKNWLLAVCVAASVPVANRGSASDRRDGVRFLWPPVCEVVHACSGLAGNQNATLPAAALGPFRNMIHLDASKARLLVGKKRRRASEEEATTDVPVGLSNNTQMWRPQLTGGIGKDACLRVLRGGKMGAEEVLNSIES